MTLTEYSGRDNTDHLQMRCGRSGIRPCPENRTTLRFLRELYDEFLDLQMAAGITYGGVRYYDLSVWPERLSLASFRKRLEGRLTRAGLLEPGARPAKVHGWFYDYSRLTVEEIPGLAVLAVWDAGGPPRVLVMREEDYRRRGKLRAASCAVSVSEKPKVLEGVVTVTEEQLQGAFAWIRRNRKALLRYWKEANCGDIMFQGIAKTAREGDGS